MREVTPRERYRYDSSGYRVSSSRWTDDPTASYHYASDGKLLYAQDDRTGERSDYIYLSGSAVAVRSVGADNQTHIKYQHTDALGSPVAVSNESGKQVDRTDWEPYGVAIGKSVYGGLGYTGHMMDGATGLTYMQQRYYEADLGLFLSVDPVSVDPRMAWNFCRYCYAGNNPYTFKDPDGRAFGIDDAAGFVVGGLVGVGVEVVKSGLTGESITWGSAAGAFVSGGIAGVGVANIPETGGLSVVAAGAVNGLISASAGNVVKQGVDIATGEQKGGFNLKELAVDGAVGAATGGVLERVLPSARVPGISAGRGNWKATAQGVRTRIENGNASNMSLKTATKGAVGTQAADSYRTAGEAATDAAKSKICGANKGACE